MIFDVWHYYSHHVSRISWNYPFSPCKFHLSDIVTQFLVYKYIIHRHNACFIAKFINFIEANRLQDDFCKNINF